MVNTLLIVSLALFWLGIETDWFTIRLPSGPAWPYDDLVLATDHEYDDIYQQDRAIEWVELLRFEAGYKAWLEERYATKLVYGAATPDNTDVVDPRDRGAAKAEALQLRRDGMAIYQRGGNR